MPRTLFTVVGLLVLLLAVPACGGGSAADAVTPPVVADVSPASGGAAGGTALVILGENLLNPQAGTYELLIGGQPAEEIIVVSDTRVECKTPPGTPGACDVVVVNLHGETTAPSAYTYYPPPTLAEITPNNGTRLGDTFVTLTGSGFMDNEPGTTIALIEDKELLDVTIVDDTTLTGRTPTSWVEVPKDVRVVNHNGQAKIPNGFTYTGPIPQIYSIEPAIGPAAGGTPCTIHGEWFTIAAGTTRVFFGNSQAANIVRIDDDTLTCTAPAGGPFWVDVRVSNGNGESSLEDGFYYIPPAPTLSAATPSQGFIMGGETITLTGMGFVNYNPGTNVVSFGGVTPTDVVVVSDTSITFTAPATSTPGNIDIYVTNNNGTATLLNGYTYLVPPVWVNIGGCRGTYNLYSVDPGTMTATSIGTGSGTITGMAFHPTTGVLYARGDCCYPGLFTLNITTGAKSSIGGNDCIGDITFVDSSTLFGQENWNGPGTVTINLSNGGITYVGYNSLWSYGNGMAADVSGNTYFANGSNLYRVNPSTGSTTYIGNMSLSNYELSAMTFHLGELLGVDGAGYSSSNILVRINTSTAATTTVGSLPTGVDALASQFPSAP